MQLADFPLYERAERFLTETGDKKTQIETTSVDWIRSRANPTPWPALAGESKS